MMQVNRHDESFRPIRPSMGGACTVTDPEIDEPVTTLEFVSSVGVDVTMV